MGSTTAQDLAENVIDIRQSIGYHLTGNHYPPVPMSMVEQRQEPRTQILAIQLNS